jgi:hypothetical protein
MSLWKNCPSHFCVPKLMHNFFCAKFKKFNFQKMTKVNNRPIGENSYNSGHIVSGHPTQMHPFIIYW